ncbi:hypothetical protein AVEN_187437-1 [Araneus ventricosus]|uniref:Uncharacterized protein n=1 Tax=Araneus ventricosus TaxID=182803 RepID=A0A4Y2BUE6_ARAVE|nr:hypothetical protein AVEN_187437-1 [Araneus ventricosus]
MKNAVAGKNSPDLATLYNMLETKLRALESLGRTKEKFADFLEHLVESCLPESVLRAWDRTRISGDADDSTSQRSLEKLMSFLRHEVEYEEMINLAREGFVKNSGIIKKNVLFQTPQIQQRQPCWLVPIFHMTGHPRSSFGLAAIHTKLGWPVIGKETGICSSDDQPVLDSVQTVFSLYVNNASSRELWDIESLGIREPIENVSKNKAFYEQLKEFHEKLTVLPDGRYEVELPWKLGARANLPDNKELALKRRKKAILRARNKGMTCFCFVLCMLMLCFINNCNKNSVYKSSKLFLSEIGSAETVLIRLIQSQYFSNANTMPSVDDFKDENVILRVKTRITERKDEPAFLNPILLPNNCTLIKCLIESVHRKHCHVGIQVILSILREKF